MARAATKRILVFQRTMLNEQVSQSAPAFARSMSLLFLEAETFAIHPAEKRLDNW
jgi:hypothetical protein